MLSFDQTREEAFRVARVSNGWVSMSEYDGPTHCAHSLHELADMVEGKEEIETVVKYNNMEIEINHSAAYRLCDIPNLIAEGRRIDAIKCLRTHTKPVMDLKSAKELLEHMFPK